MKSFISEDDIEQALVDFFTREPLPEALHSADTLFYTGEMPKSGKCPAAISTRWFQVNIIYCK